MIGVLLVTVNVVGLGWAGEGWTVEQLCADQPERVQRLCSALDLDRDGLAAVKAAVAGEDWPGACRSLLAYYRSSDAAPWPREAPPKQGAGRDAAADAILDDRFTLYTIEAKVPRRADGGLDWTYNGPDGDREWGWGLNRMFWVGTLLGAYRTTGNPEYVRHCDRLIRDWVLANPYPGQKTSAPQWRGLETFMRIQSAWPTVFYGLLNDENVSPVTQILLLSSVPDHAHYGRNFHAAKGNWLAMELLGLAHAAVLWPEFNDADAWFEYAVNRMIPEVTTQVYPDGVQKELTSHYHRVTMHSFDRFAKLAESAGREMPEPFRAGVEGMYNYLAFSMRPSGYGPLNNDSNLDFTRPEVLGRCDAFQRPDWRYIATNGAEGTPPEGLPSVVFPWAGQVIMRSAWDGDAHWAYFEAGPFGIGHQHHDKLHLSVTAYGRDILVDGGRYSYVGGPWRRYFVGSPSHNVILVDGAGQNARELEVSEPMADTFAIRPEFDYARAVFDAGYGETPGAARHTRAVFYVRGEYWVVVDRIETDRPRTLQALWHYHPECTVTADGTSVASNDADKGNVRITPFGPVPWDVAIVKGREEPDIQGWWSREYNVKEPSPCAVYTGAVNETIIFGWVLTPGRGDAPRCGQPATITMEGPVAVVSVEIENGGAARELRVPLDGPATQAEIR